MLMLADLLRSVLELGGPDPWDATHAGRVRGPDGSPPSIGRSLVRLIGLLLSIVPLFAGFVPVLFTERRRGLADFLAGTVVVYEP